MAMEEDEGEATVNAGRESILKHVLCEGNFLTSPPTADTFHSPYPSIASPSISRDVPLARARAFNSLNLYLGSGQGCPLLRASNEHSSSWAFCEQVRAPGRSLSSCLSYSRGVCRIGVGGGVIAERIPVDAALIRDAQSSVGRVIRPRQTVKPHILAELRLF